MISLSTRFALASLNLAAISSVSSSSDGNMRSISLGVTTAQQYGHSWFGLQSKSIGKFKDGSK